MFNIKMNFSRKEAEELKSEVAKWRVAEAAAREKLLSITQLNQSIAISNATTHAQHNLVQSSPTSTRTLSPPPVKQTKINVLIISCLSHSIGRWDELKRLIHQMNGLFK